jgi:hypothetical protein
LIPIPALSTNEPGTGYVAFKIVSGEKYPSCNFTNMLKFTSKEVDPSTGEPEETGYDDEYQVEDLELGSTDWVIPAFAGSWETVWDGASGGDEATETMILSGAKDIAGRLPWPSLGSNSLNFSQTRSHNLQPCSKCSPWTAVMFLCRTPHTLSSCTAPRFIMERLRSWFAWHIRARRASRCRFVPGARKTVLPLRWWAA